MKKLIFLLFCILSIQLNPKVYCQIIQGVVTDPITQQGIPNLQVCIGDCTTVTDSVGHYIINLGMPVSVINEKTKTLTPKEFRLFQNYPNPFNAETTITFQLPKASDAEIKIYNIYGQEIKSLLNQKMQAGAHKVIWDGTNHFGAYVSSGIYIVHFSTLDFQKSIKTILLK